MLLEHLDGYEAAQCIAAGGAVAAARGPARASPQAELRREKEAGEALGEKGEAEELLRSALKHHPPAVVVGLR